MTIHFNSGTGCGTVVPPKWYCKKRIPVQAQRKTMLQLTAPIQINSLCTLMMAASTSFAIKKLSILIKISLKDVL